MILHHHQQLLAHVFDDDVVEYYDVDDDTSSPPSPFSLIDRAASSIQVLSSSFMFQSVLKIFRMFDKIISSWYLFSLSLSLMTLFPWYKFHHHPGWTSEDNSSLIRSTNNSFDNSCGRLWQLSMGRPSPWMKFYQISVDKSFWGVLQILHGELTWSVNEIEKGRNGH